MAKMLLFGHSNAENLSASRGPDPLIRGSAPGPRWMLRFQTPLYARASRSPCVSAYDALAGFQPPENNFFLRPIVTAAVT